MARRPETAAAMGRRIREQRERHDPKLSLLDLTLELRHRLPPSEWVTDETLRRYETGKVAPEKADVLIMVAVADVLGCRLSDLSVTVAEQVDKARDLLVHARRCFAGAA